ncbi:MAG: orotidine-5'-phosphate decarboxylase, partial [Actinomycetota bacterium]|nr:orotidine-5'-phosphate decarboxylase [Actinomycetota bacterium]
MTNPVLVALDVPRLDKAESLARRLAPHVGGFKVGLELIMSHGPSAVASIAKLGLPVFADVKLHDIPNTVEASASAMGAHGARWVTAHASGGKEMLRAAVRGLKSGAAEGPVGVLAVTVLTSLDRSDLDATGTKGDVHDQVLRLGRLAAATGAEGVICSPAEVPSLKGISPSLVA